MHSLRLTDDSQARRSRLHPGNLGAGSSRATAAVEPTMARAPVHPVNTSTNPAIVEPSNKTLGDDMDEEKSVLEQMTDAVSNAAGATKEAAKTAVKKVKKAARKVAKKMTPKKAKKNEKGFEEILGEKASQKG